MTKSDLIEAVAEKLKLPKGKAELIVNCIFDSMEEALKVANERLLRAAVMTAASGVLVNPKLAPGLLNLSQFEVDDDGNVDERAISAAIADLVENEPYLSGATPEPAWGPAGGGAREQTKSRSMDPMERELRSRLGL